MNSMSGINNILYIVLAMTIILVMVLIFVYIYIKLKEKKQSQEAILKTNKKKEKIQTTKTSVKVAKEYETKSILDFMEFEEVKDNMIIQKSGKRFLMVVECQGVNYDLMSEVEKTSTERGFALFLNTLKEPIQIYIQARTVNLEKNIRDYKVRLDKIREQLNLKEYRLKQYMQQNYINEKVVSNKQFEILRETNLYDYGRDIIADTERMSLNKNVLKKKYYIILKYFYEPLDANEDEVLSEEEISDIAFSNLYTKAASMIGILSGIGIVGKTLNSFELVDLLYNAYNRDDSEVFGIEKAMEAGYNEIFVDSQSIIDKKMEALNKEIELRAQEKAKNAMEEVVEEREKEMLDIENNIDTIIEELAIKVIGDEQNSIPEDVKKKAIEKIQEKSKKKGEKETNGKKETSRKRRTV